MKFSIRKLLVGLIIVIVLAFILLRGDQLVELGETIQKGAIVPLIAAVLTQLCKYFAQSFAYSFCFSAVGEKMDPRTTLPLVFGTFFMNTIAPSLNMAGATLVVDDARRRGISPGKATSAALLMQITIEGGFATIMVVGFAILLITGNLDWVWLLLGLVVFLMIGIMGGLMIMGNRNPALLTRLLLPVERFVNRVRAKFKKGPLKPWVESAVGSFGEAAGLIMTDPKHALKAYGCSVLASSCELACFCLVGVAFSVYNPQALICGYVVATLFAMISFTPQGVGVVEAAVTALFAGFGVDGAAGLAIALVYRSFVFWMPFLIGAILIQRTKLFKDDKDKKSGKKTSSKRGRHLKDPGSGDDDADPDRPIPLDGSTLDTKRLDEGRDTYPYSKSMTDASRENKDIHHR